VNRTVFLSAGITCLFLSSQLYGHPVEAKKAGLDFSQHYLLLATTRSSTMQKELRQAAAAGYRVLAGWSADEVKITPHSYSYTRGQLVMLLEKVTAPPNSYDYLLLATVRSSTLQKELREAAARGYRLVPHAVISDTKMLMERAEGSSSRYDYLFLTQDSMNIPVGENVATASLETINLRAATHSYAIVGTLCDSTGGEAEENGSVSAVHVQHVLIAEKPLQPEAEAVSRESRISASERYLLLVGRPGASLAELLSRGAGQDYRLLLASDAKCPEAALVMEKVAQPDQPYQYMVVSGQDQLSAAAARGFHPHPEGLLGRFGIIMEKAPGSENRDKYFFVEKTSSSALQEWLADASAEGLDVVAASRTAHAVILRKAAGPTEETPAAASEQPQVGPEAPHPSGAASPEDGMAIPPGSKVYVRPMGGFETHIIAALKKKKLPLVVVIAPEDAEFEISGTTNIREPSKGVKVLEGIGEIAAGVSRTESAGLPRKMVVSISVRNVGTGAVILEHSVSKRTTARALAHYQQSAAEECVDQLKKKISERKPN
jgi:hypothetical protein